MIDLETVPLDVTSHIIKFRDFLISCWPKLEELMEEHDWDDDGNFIIDWLQANWEFLVERELLGKGNYLPLFTWGGRKTSSEKAANYKIVCQIDNKDCLIDKFTKTRNFANEELYISVFLTPMGTSYWWHPPFDYVNLRTLDQKKLYTVPFDSVRFILKKNSEEIQE